MGLRRNYTTTIAVLLFALASCSQASPVDSAKESPVELNNYAIHKRDIPHAFPHRYNSGNDGTPYEPCYGPSNAQIRKLGLDPASIKDAALVDGQKARGCEWHGDRVIVNHYVGNEKGGDIDAYRATYGTLAKWEPDTVIDGRKVIVAHVGNLSCTAMISSRKSIVFSSVLATAKSRPEVCALAIQFIRETVSSIPR